MWLDCSGHARDEILDGGKRISPHSNPTIMDKGVVVNPPKHNDFQALDKVFTHERTTKWRHHQPEATNLARIARATAHQRSDSHPHPPRLLVGGQTSH